MRKQELEKALTQKLKLKSPLFKLTKYENAFSGHVVSDTFKGKGDFQRRQMIRAAIESSFGKDANRKVGMILPYTLDEWGVDLQGFHTTTKRKAKAG